MFCYQCEETSKGKGCNIKGVCGKTAHGSISISTSLLQYELDSNAMDVKKYTTLSNIEKSYKLGIKALDEIDMVIKK